MSVGGADFLYQYDITANQLTSSPLPHTDYNGYLSRVRVGTDGSIWVTEPYTLIRFDPASRQLASTQLGVADRSETLDGSAAAADSGTWISALAVDPSGQAIIARHNVSALVVFDASLTEVRRVNVPQGFEGAADLAILGSDIFVTPYLGKVPYSLVMLEDGTIVTKIDGAANRLVPDGTRVLTVGGRLQTWLAADGSSLPVLPGPSTLSIPASAVIGDVGDRAAATPDGGFVLSHRVGILQRIDAAGSVTQQIRLPSPLVTVLNPGGIEVQVRAPTQISAIAFDAAGRTWFVDLTDSVLEDVVL